MNGDIAKKIAAQNQRIDDLMIECRDESFLFMHEMIYLDGESGPG